MRVLFIGGYGHHYLARAVEAGLVEVAGCASDGVDDEAAAKLPGRFDGDPPHFDDYRKALDALLPDAVSVGAVYSHNGEVIAEALERGLKVVSDKPVATTWKQFERIEKLCAGGEHVLLTEFDLRSRGNFRAAQQAVVQGLIGQPVLATAQKSYRFGDSRPWFYKKRETYGGTLAWIASHGIDAVRFVTGCELTHVCGHQGNVAKPDYDEMEDHVAVCYALDNGGSALVHADFLRPAAAPSHGDDRIRVVGSLGQVESRNGQCELITADAGPRDITDLGATADIGADLVAALNGETSYYNTGQSLCMGRVLLVSRDAADRGDVCTIVNG